MATVFQEMISSGDVVPVPILLDLYHAVIASGEIPETSGVELIDGTIVRKDRRDSPQDSIMTHGPRHFTVLQRLQSLLLQETAARPLIVRTQGPVTIHPHHEPEPDIAIVHGSISDYSNRHPDVGDVLLVIEISLPSLRADRTSKKLLYGTAGIPEYWVVDVEAQAIDVFTEPGTDGQGYAETQRYSIADAVPVRLDADTHWMSVARIFEE